VRLAAVPRLLRDSLEAVLVAVLFAFFVRTFVLQAFRIPTSSMEPGLLVGDHVLVNKFVYGPSRWAWERALLPLAAVARGDVVVFRYPRDASRDFVKRCVATGHDQLALRAKRLSVNGVPVDERGYVRLVDEAIYPDSPFLEDVYRRRDHLRPLGLAADQLFCLGDNRDVSNDSRYWGPVPRSFVKGRALLVYWSVAPSQGRGQPLAAAVLDVSRRTRWRRTLQLVR